MKQNQPEKPDINQTAARIVNESTSKPDAKPASLEAAWEAWSRGVGKVDSRGMALLRAAFEAGAEVGKGLTKIAR